jgi:rubrerythrin
VIEGGYPVDVYDDVIALLKSAAHNEYEEYEDVYKKFAEVASQEGYQKVANDFKQIAEVEKVHGDRFNNLLKGLESKTLYQNPTQIRWMCLNCGTIIETSSAPNKCPVCNYDQGYFVRLDYAPYTTKELLQ